MMFWIKNLVLGALLIGVAYFLLTGQNFLVIFKKDPPAPAPAVEARVVRPTIVEEKEDKGAFSSSATGAGSGLSNFYGKIKSELLGTNTTEGDGFVLLLKPSKYTIDEELLHREKTVTPASQNFKGKEVTRNFRAGDTIREKLAAAAQDEGMALIWRLDRDYVIKHYFQVESSLLTTLGTVATALDSDFEKDVFAYYCYKQRAIVITHESSDYLLSNCRRVTSRSQ